MPGSLAHTTANEMLPAHWLTSLANPPLLPCDLAQYTEAVEGEEGAEGGKDE